MGGVHGRLAGRHTDVQEEVLVARGEFEHSAALLGIQRVQLGDARGDRLDQQRAGRPVTVVALVAHVHRLGNERSQIDPIRHAAQGRAERRAQDAPHPVQALEHVWPESAVAQNAPEAFVQD